MKTGPKIARPQELTYQPRFAYAEMAEVAVVSGPEDGTELGSGYVLMTNAEIPWTIKYDEVVLVVEGELTIRTAEGDLTAGPGETFWLPEATELTYVADNALVFYAIHPANWAEAR